MPNLLNKVILDAVISSCWPGDAVAGVEFLHQEGQYGGFDISFKGLEALCSQTVTHLHLKAVGFKKDPQNLGHGVVTQLQIHQFLSKNLYRLRWWEVKNKII